MKVLMPIAAILKCVFVLQLLYSLFSIDMMEKLNQPTHFMFAAAGNWQWYVGLLIAILTVIYVVNLIIANFIAFSPKGKFTQRFYKKTPAMMFYIFEILLFIGSCAMCYYVFIETIGNSHHSVSDIWKAPSTEGKIEAYFELINKINYANLVTPVIASAILLAIFWRVRAKNISASNS